MKDCWLSLAFSTPNGEPGSDPVSFNFSDINSWLEMSKDFGPILERSNSMFLFKSLTIYSLDFISM